jgi:phenylacetate-CoA ligase
MNQFNNPLFLLKILKSYLTDIDRIWKFDDEKLIKYRDNSFRNIVKFAYEHIPLYHEKYKNLKISPNDIKTISDISKLPFITKDDLRNNYPEGIISKNFNKNNGFLLSTSGSTGRPVFLYYDALSAIKSLEGYVRILKAYGGKWTKSKIMLIIDLESGSIENTMFSSSILPLLKKLISIDNMKYIHIGEKPENIIKEICEFKPEFLGSDPNMLRKLSYLKYQGFGKDFDLKCIFSGGSMLDDYTRKYIEKAFNTTVYNLYGTTEAGPLAFECVEKRYHHVHSDFVYMEILDENNQPVPFNVSGALVVTKLYGTGTPIIRYTGINDFLIPINVKTKCGITTQMIGEIQGRIVDMIHLPDGNMLAPLTITGIPAKVMEEFNDYKIKQFQIIQHDIHNIEVLIVIDQNMRNTGVKVEKIFQEMQNRFIKKIGKEIKISIKETDYIQKDTRSDYVKAVVSKIKKNL